MMILLPFPEGIRSMMAGVYILGSLFTLVICIKVIERIVQLKALL
jgi:hypothetical protein